VDWSNERYVRVYTRDTTAMLLMAWDELALFWALVRKVDRSGVLGLDGHGARAVAVHLRCPVDVAERAVASWVREGWVELREGSTLLVVEHLDAQEAQVSDKQRQRDMRERRRATASVTPRDNVSRHVTEPSRAVTGGHAESRAVTLANQLTDLTNQDPPKSPTGDDVGSRTNVREVCDHYTATWLRLVNTGKQPAWTAKRRKKVALRLGEGYSVADLKKAASHILTPSSFWAQNGHTVPEYFMRSAEQVDKVLSKVSLVTGDASRAEHERGAAARSAELHEAGERLRQKREQADADAHHDAMRETAVPLSSMAELAQGVLGGLKP